MDNKEILDRISRLEKQLRRRRQSSSSNNSISPPPKRRRCRVISSDEEPSDIMLDKDKQTVTEINSEEVFSILGDDPTLDKKYSDDIHPHIAVRWNNILQKGLKKENRADLIKAYLPPENCTFIAPPKLNEEIRAAVQETAIKRDVKLEQKQLQLGAGITSLGRAIDIAQKIPEKNLRDQLIKHLGNSGQILTDLHYLESLTRRSLLVQGLNKNTKDAIKDLPRDELLFGTTLADKLKAIKACSKSAVDIKIKPQKITNSRHKYDLRPSSNARQGSATLNWRGSSRRATNNTMVHAAFRSSQLGAAAGSRQAQTSQRPSTIKRT